MAKHEVLRFGVDMGSLCGGCKEGKTNFEPTVSGFNAAKARAASNLACLSIHCGERQLCSCAEGCFSSIQEVWQVVRVRHESDRNFPQLSILDGEPESGHPLHRL